MCSKKIERNHNIRLIYIADIRFPMERANAIQSINTCHALAESGINVHFLVRRMNHLRDEECLDYYGLKPNKKLKLHRLPVINTKKSYFLWKISFIISSFLKTIQLSITKQKLVYFTRELRIAGIFKYLSILFNAKIIFEVHTINYRNFSEIHLLYSKKSKIPGRQIRWKKQREKRIYKKMDGIITITDHLKDQLIVDFKLKCPISVVRDAADPLKNIDFNRPKEGICYVGQLYPWKGVDLLIKAMVKLDKEKLYIIGGLEYENDLENLRKLTAKLKLQDRITFTGTIPHKKVDEYISNAKICVIPLPFSQIAAYYTSPLKMFEYLAAGKAIVASRLPSLCEVLEDERNALLFEPGDIQSLLKALKRLLKDDSFRKKLEQNAWRDSHMYSWQKRAEGIISLFSQI